MVERGERRLDLIIPPTSRDLLQRPLVSRGVSPFAVDLPDDLVGGLDPGEGLAALVPAVDEYFDGGDEVFH